jgi:hypothetical protein
MHVTSPVNEGFDLILRESMRGRGKTTQLVGIDRGLPAWFAGKTARNLDPKWRS